MDPTQRWHIVWGLYNDAFNWRFKKNNRVCNRNIRFQVLIFWHTRVRYFTFKNTIFRLKILKRSSWQKKRENPFSLYIYCWGLRIGVSDTGNKTVWCLKSQSIKITIFVHSRKRTKYLWRTDSWKCISFAEQMNLKNFLNQRILGETKKAN